MFLHVCIFLYYGAWFFNLSFCDSNPPKSSTVRTFTLFKLFPNLLNSWNKCFISMPIDQKVHMIHKTHQIYHFIGFKKSKNCIQYAYHMIAWNFGTFNSGMRHCTVWFIDSYLVYLILRYFGIYSQSSQEWYLSLEFFRRRITSGVAIFFALKASYGLGQITKPKYRENSLFDGRWPLLECALDPSF